MAHDLGGGGESKGFELFLSTRRYVIRSRLFEIPHARAHEQISIFANDELVESSKSLKSRHRSLQKVH